MTGGRIERAVVSRLAEKTFYATLAVRTGDRSEERDARPSDAINLAVRLGVPIYVQEDVMETSGIAGRDELDAEADAIVDGPPSEWRTLSPELVKSMWEARIPKVIFRSGGGLCPSPLTHVEGRTPNEVVMARAKREPDFVRRG